MAASNNFEFITRAKLCGHLLRRQEQQKEAKKRPQDGKRAAVYVSLNYETGRPQKLLANSQEHWEKNRISNNY